MKTRSLPVLFLCAITATQVHAQPNPKADLLYREALGLHIDGKHDQALARVQAALKLSLKNQQLKDYESELTRTLANEKLYQHARQAPSAAEESVASLAAYLVKPAQSDEDKARLIYGWVTDRVAYDVEGRKTGKRGEQSAEGVLKSRVAVCEGYANLYTELGKAAGIEVVKISGLCKEGSYVSGKPSRHAWNAVRLHGEWRLIDPTWGAGNANSTTFVKKFKEYYFLADPDTLIFTHLPADPQWQRVKSEISQEQFSAWPKVHGQLFSYGISPGGVRATLEKGVASIVEPLELPKHGPPIIVKSAPLERKLKAGQKYRFQVEAPGFSIMYVANGPKPVRANPVSGVFDLDVVAQPGKLMVAGRNINDPGTGYFGILRYEVE